MPQPPNPKKILLIGAYTNERSGDTSIDKTYLKKQFVSPPLGLYRLRQFLKEKIEVRILDPNIENAEEFLKNNGSEYSVIGNSLTHPTLEYDFSLLWLAKSVNPKALLLAGGEEAYFNYEQVFSYSPADLVVQGEGEAPLTALADALLEESYTKEKLLVALKKTPGFYSRNSDGSIHKASMNTALAPEVFVRATVGMDFSEIPYKKYWNYMEEFYPNRDNEVFQKTRTVRLFVSNHCPLKCTFCSSTNFLMNAKGGPGKVAWVTAPHLLEMIKSVCRTHPDVRSIFFHDDNFTLGKTGHDRAIELSQLVIEAKKSGKIPNYLGFMAQCRITDVTASMLKSMAEAGFWMMSYGIESFSQNILNEFNKNVTVEQIEKGLESNFQAGIFPFANIILTSPNCTLVDCWATTKRCAELVALGAEIGMNPYCMAFPGANMLKDPEVLDRVSSKTVNVPGTSISFRKTDKLIPRNEKVRNLLDLMEYNVDQLYDGRKVTSARRSNIIIYSLLKGFVTMNFHREHATQLLNLMQPHIQVEAPSTPLNQSTDLKSSSVEFSS